VPHFWIQVYDAPAPPPLDEGIAPPDLERRKPPKDQGAWDGDKPKPDQQIRFHGKMVTFVREEASPPTPPKPKYDGTLICTDP
jgi:hypothetical protein